MRPRIGNVGRGSAFAMRGTGAHAMTAEFCALQACMEGLQVATIESVVFETGSSRNWCYNTRSNIKDGVRSGCCGDR